ncbi:VIT1/CCC1 transporter family protein [Telmatospirillum siberiense]|uniref:Rubrerythrin family protein n=1 Tax=Telmatospirillum siberiense TaxID=382514 RepID=A0A2N3PZV4_9PROT|nr:VIT1/CCC1 family protein [Telmatospirillum siberiense]PKU25891.1 rubrerythrin family protein [Telmatospirillum siberiense]
MVNPTPESRYRSNLQGEVDSSALYRALAEVEGDSRLAKIFARLAAIEDAHVAFWQAKLAKAGLPVSIPKPSPRTRLLTWLARRMGVSFVLPTVNALEQADIGSYDNQPEAVAGRLPAAERSHARIVQAIAQQSSGSAGLSGSALANLEGRHRAMGGNALRAAVLGANDGLVSNLSLVMAIAGAMADRHVILLTGAAGLVAGACSMAMGEWLSVNSSRELYQRQIATEAEELSQSPDEEREELILIYQAKGLGEAEARELAGRMMANTQTALDTLVREELGIDPESLGGSAWSAAITSFGLFGLGAIFPILPYCFLDGVPALLGSLGASGAALCGIGAGTALFTGRSFLFSATRQLLIGFAAAGLTFGIGRLVGVSLGG